ncbi:hypothetical protein AGLY_011275 [Aphis glycines]|uniref:Uncharacterized protein n=1 Tax=Aphis glycines TaxID=307491 RepID=A0A6G0TCZ2_APHGL|nr:hypothetical protein AGLY_011275 [Aphis glycines]
MYRVCENKSINYTFINTICNIVVHRQYYNIENVKKLMSTNRYLNSNKSPKKSSEIKLVLSHGPYILNNKICGSLIFVYWNFHIIYGRKYLNTPNSVTLNRPVKILELGGPIPFLSGAEEQFPVSLFLPESVILRWSTWIKSASLYCENFMETKGISNQFNSFDLSVMPRKHLKTRRYNTI